MENHMPGSRRDSGGAVVSGSPEFCPDCRDWQGDLCQEHFLKAQGKRSLA